MALCFIGLWHCDASKKINNLIRPFQRQIDPFMFYSTHTTQVFWATKMDSFHLVLYRRETRLACRGYEELTVELTTYQRKH